MAIKLKTKIIEKGFQSARRQIMVNKYQDIETAIKKVNKKNWSTNNCNFSCL